MGMRLHFHVADVSKPLLSVKRIADCGNAVHFGPGEHDNYIYNPESGHKVMLRETRSGSYVLDVALAESGRTEITVDSGAEDNVCPTDWAPEFPCGHAAVMKQFRGANGHAIRHWGDKEVLVTSPF